MGDFPTIAELRSKYPDIRSMRDVLKRHPDFRPREKHTQDTPTAEEVWAANCMTAEEMAQAKHVYQLERARVMADRELGAMEAQAERIAQKTAAAGIPVRFRTTPLDLRYSKALDAGRGLYIFGVQGSGKTTTACATLRGWISRHIDGGQPLFVTSVGLLDELSATFGTPESEKAVMGRYGSCPLLIVDDLGKDVPTPRALARLWQLIDMRYGAMLPTIVTTQYDGNELVRELGRSGGLDTAKAITSRLIETCEPVDCGRQDRRVR